jgi:hypothetical protein
MGELVCCDEPVNEMQRWCVWKECEGGCRCWQTLYEGADDRDSEAFSPLNGWCLAGFPQTRGPETDT